MKNLWSIKKLTEEQEKNVLDSFKKDREVWIRASNLVKKIANIEPGQSFLENDEEIHELENPQKGTILEKIIEVLFEQSPETLEDIIEYEKKLEKNSTKIPIQSIEKSEGIDIEEFIPYNDFESSDKLNPKKISSFQSIIGSKNVKMRIFKPQSVTPKRVEEKSNEIKIILPDNLWEKADTFLKAKKSFTNSREEVIESLKSHHGEMYSYLEKNDILESIKGMSLAIVEVVNIFSKNFSQEIKALKLLSKSYFDKNNGKINEQIYNTLRDSEEDLDLLSKTFETLYEEIDKHGEKFNALIDILKINKKNIEEEIRFFESKYLIFEIIDGILWKGKASLNLEEIGKAIELLTKNLEDLKNEIKQQRKKIEKKSEIF